MARRGLVSIIGTLWCASCATAPPSPDALRVDDFRIEGEAHLSEGDLKEKIVTGDWFDANTWQADLRRIRRLYEANGYYQARVLDDVVTPARPQHVKLLVKLREGEPARVRSLALTGLEALPPAMQTEISSELPLSPGDIFLEDSWARTKTLLGKRLRELGFAEALVTGEALVDPSASSVDLTLTIVTGIRYRFGKSFAVPYVGAQVPLKLITEVAAPDVPPGDYFSESAMAEAQSRVLEMGIFAGVKVTRGAPERATGTVPVIIDAKEAPFHSIRLGGGFGGDLIRQEVRLIGEYTNRDLGLSRLFTKDARLDRLTLKAKLGIAFLPNIVEVIGATSTSNWGPTWRLYGQYEVPWLFNQRTLSLQSSLDVMREFDSTYDYYAADVKSGVVWRPRGDLTIFPSLNLNSFLLNTKLELRDTAPAGALGCPLAPNVCWVAYLDFNVEFDRRDSRLEAKDGYYLALDTAAGLSSTTALRPFLKVTPEARGYFSFGHHKQFTLAGRVKAGTLLAPDNDTPIVVRYFSGGAGMRGFSQRRLSPQLVVATADKDLGCKGDPSCTYDGTTLPVGGAGLFEAAAELRWAVTENWVLALFNDWGLVTTTPLGSGQDWGQSLYTALGLGVRYRTPLGPIRVDLAYRIPFIGGPLCSRDPSPGRRTCQPEGGPTQQFRSSPGCFFGLGSGQPLSDPYTRDVQAGPGAGSPDNACSAHLSIGEAF